MEMDIPVPTSQLSVSKAVEDHAAANDATAQQDLNYLLAESLQV
jgi:hypothetical protein